MSRMKTYSKEDMRILNTPICDLNEEDRGRLQEIMKNERCPLIIID